MIALTPRLAPFSALLALLTLGAACQTPATNASAAGEPPAAVAADNGSREELEPLDDWPPTPGRPYPAVAFRDHDGRAVSLSSFRGKVLLIEPIGMNCPACNAFAGGLRPGTGGFDGVRPQANLLSATEIVARYGNGATLDHPDLIFVHLLLYDMQMRAPSREDARRWAEHFGVDAPNHLVLYGDERFINPGSYNMIPGFQLVDRNQVLVSDSTGHRPRHDLYRDLLPLLGRMLREGSGS